MINERPKLNMELDSAFFRNFYYLKQELIDFGRENRLPTLGSETNLRIESHTFWTWEMC